MADLVTQAALLADVDAKVTTNGANENTGARVNSNLHNIVDTLWNHAGIAGVDVGTCVFVNATTGDDATGVRGRMDKMYETLDAAYAASVAGDVIIGWDKSTYTFANNVTKDLNLYFPNATIDVGSDMILAASGITVTVECKKLLGFIQFDGIATGITLNILNTEGPDAIFIGETSTVNIRNSKSFASDECGTGDGSVVNVFGSEVGTISNTDSGSRSVYVTLSKCYQVLETSGVTTLYAQKSFFDNISPGGVTIDPSSAGNTGLVQPLLSAIFSTSTTAADPGDGQFRFNDGTFASVTKIYISVTDSNGNDITAYLDSLTGGQLEMRTLDYSKRILFDVSTVDTASAYRKINVTPVLGSIPVEGEFYTFDFREAGGSSTLTDSIGGLIEVATDTTYRLGGPSAFAYTIESLDVETDSGTITVAVKINGTAVTGLSAVSASSTPSNTAATAANVVAVGDYLTFEGSSNSAATGLLFGITITRTP